MEISLPDFGKVCKMYQYSNGNVPKDLKESYQLKKVSLFSEMFCSNVCSQTTNKLQIWFPLTIMSPDRWADRDSEYVKPTCRQDPKQKQNKSTQTKIATAKRTILRRIFEAENACLSVYTRKTNVKNSKWYQDGLQNRVLSSFLDSYLFCYTC